MLTHNTSQQSHRYYTLYKKVKILYRVKTYVFPVMSDFYSFHTLQKRVIGGNGDIQTQ
jgi:hypothetical protein